jgi:PAS domain S-box-containing protein
MPVNPKDLSQRHLAKIVDSSDDAIVSKNLDGVIQSWNTAAERMFGFTAREAVGQSIRMIIPADRQHEEDYVLGQIRAGHAVRHFETIRQRKDGSLIPISLTVSPIYDDTGTVIGASKIARDISDRKTADLTARRLAAVVESSDDAIVSKNLDSIILSWNRAAERMFGFTAEEALGKSVRMIIPADLQQEEDEVLARIRAGKTVDHYETRRLRKDGTEILISLTVSPITDDQGHVVGASKIARDITERSRLENEVRKQAHVNEQLSRAGAEVASSLDEGRIVDRVVELGTDLTGATVGTYAAAFAGDLPIRVEDTRRDGGHEHAGPLRAVHPGGPEIRSYLAVPVRSVEGTVVGGLFFGHPEPGRFTAHHEQLAIGMAAWAAVALENARLYIDAREADRLKDEFLAVLSHELRTPLNAILGYARLLRGGVLGGEKMNAGIEALERNATALTQIVEDVLDISRIVSGKIRLDVQSVDLGQVARDAIATLRPALDAKGIRLQTIIDPRVAPVSGDPDRLQQVVWNLLSNATKFTPRGGRVQVRVERVNSHVEIIVSDTGAGIRRDFLPFVFDRFRQADSGTTRKTGGLGLGLAIVRQLVELHGGTVQASSEGEGMGATFRVRLPTMIVHREPAPEPRTHPRAQAAAPTLLLSDLSGIRIVAIDDDVDALGLVRVVFESAGAEVHSFPSAADALDRLAAIKPQVLVVDLGMPTMDGFEFIRRVRQLPEPAVARLPAAALTAFARSEDRVKALNAGFEMHLAKPVDPAELVAAVSALVRRHTSRA